MERGILTVSQLLEINDLTGRLTTDENRALFEELAIFPHLQHKLRLFVRNFRRGPIVDKMVCPVTTGSFLFQIEKNLSQTFRRQLRHQLHKKIEMPPSYLTHQRDGVMLPQCPCSRPRPKRQPFKFSTAQSGHRTKPSNRAWPWNPPASDVKKL